MYSISLENVPTVSLSEFMKSRKENNGSVGHTPSFQMPVHSSETTDSVNSQKTSAKDNSNGSDTQISDYAKAEKLYSQLQQQAWLDQLKK
ncbi:hypothetical protein J7J47_18385 [Halomonas sp. ISL-60]|uniref:hypothetical protein n=1 Tax=Halomonas sp. ISL-56 TaxID=2819149 RepID=UPI001BE7CEA4|nr:hypothetical protein [Halomonas sp. ISL-56]MBT2774197.1 hypothetical protein [Halomonas sp. ISL-60]MBT2801315.1 hypothetical protein [Halomonas sp. ISL-56]